MACESPKQEQKFNYPETAKVDTVDTYFGTEVADPYRWLEDDNSQETKAWVKEQNKLTFGYLEKIPFREKIKKRLTQVWDYEKISAPFKSGGRWFVSKNDGLQNQNVLYILNELGGEETLFLDPNTLSEDGTVSLTSFRVSKDGKYAGYGISRGGSDWNEFFIRDVETGEDLTDHIKWVKFSGMAWYKEGFFYSRYPEPKEGDALKGMNTNSMIYYHKVGTDQSEDKLFYKDPEHPEWGFSAGITEDDKYMIINVSESTSGNAFYIKDLTTPDSDIVKIVEDFENDFSVIDHDKGKLLVMTNYQAPRYKVIAIDPQNPARENWVDVISEKKEVLSTVSVVAESMIAQYLKDAHDIAMVFGMDGSFVHEIEFPVLGSVSGFGGKKEDSFTFYTLTSFTTPSMVYKYEVATNTSTFYQKSKIDFDPTPYETKQVFYKSKDGTEVPMFIVHKKDIKLDGTNPTMLYGYGGFNISLTPRFSMRWLIWLENGGVFVTANLRGGGEYGEDWHKAGTLMQKQNVFDDFIAAAEYLIDNKYTSPEKLAIMGGSNGGLLVGAVLNQRPDLFKVGFPAVGVMDMLRYHKFTIGRYWATDYGTSEDSPEMFNYLYNYSPLHTIKKVEYPAVMVTTADHDDRVVPAHSFKYIATLQEKNRGDNPVMIRIEVDAGHGAGTPTSKAIEEYTDYMAFALYNLGVTPEY